MLERIKKLFSKLETVVRTKTPKGEVELRLLFTKDVAGWMNKLQTESRSISWAEVIRRALSVYYVIARHCISGGEIVLRNKDGKEEVLRLKEFVSK